MTFTRRYYKIKTLHWHIEKKATGTAIQMAKKLGIGKTALFEYLNILKDFGAEIEFCRNRGSYYYLNEFQFPC